MSEPEQGTIDTAPMVDAITHLGVALNKAVSVCGPLLIMYHLSREIAGLAAFVNNNLQGTETDRVMKENAIGTPPTTSVN